MKILGFNFTKIQVEKFKDKVEGLKIGTRMDISSISEAKADILNTKDSILAVKFKYGLDYEPKFAKLDFEGNLLVSVEEKIGKDILSQWKSKKMPEDFRLKIFNLILRKSSLKAIQLEEEMNLPIHFQMPSLKINKE